MKEFRTFSCRSLSPTSCVRWPFGLFLYQFRPQGPDMACARVRFTLRFGLSRAFETATTLGGNMNNRRSIFVAALLSALIAGCASFTPQELSSFDYGPYPENYKDIIRGYIDARLKDPSSAILEYRAGPGQVWQKGSIISSKEYGWGVCLWINAKNSYGGYVGRRPYAFLIRNGAIVHVHGEMGTNMFDTALAQGMCKQLGAA